MLPVLVHFLIFAQYLHHFFQLAGRLFIVNGLGQLTQLGFYFAEQLSFLYQVHGIGGEFRVLEIHFGQQLFISQSHQFVFGLIDLQLVQVLQSFLFFLVFLLLQIEFFLLPFIQEIKTNTTDQYIDQVSPKGLVPGRKDPECINIRC